MNSHHEIYDPSTQAALSGLEFENAPHIDQGLYSGVITTHLFPQTQEFRIATALRSVCDAFVGITILTDSSGDTINGSTPLASADITLTHFLPTDPLRRGHANTIEDAAENHQPGIRFALLLVSLPLTRYGSANTLAEIKAQAKAFNNGIDPDIVAVDDELPEVFRPYDIVLTRTLVDGRLQYILEVTNTTYKRVFFADEAQEAAQCAPITLVVRE